MQLQKIFDVGVAGVLKQGAFSYEADVQACLYRGPNDTRCALGWSIPDDLYAPSLEGHIPFVGNPIGVMFGAVTARDAQALQQFQECHDEAARENEGLEGFKARARAFAKANGLDSKVLDNA